MPDDPLLLAYAAITASLTTVMGGDATRVQ